MAAPRPAPTLSGAGFTLVETAVAALLAGVIVSLALPSYLEHLTRVRRMEAATALQRVHAAQERHRQHHGYYAATLAELPGAMSSTTEGGRWQITLHRIDGAAYEAVARVQPAPAADAQCPSLTLRVTGVISDRGPSAQCWGS